MYVHTFFKCPKDVTHCSTLFFYFIILCLDSIIYFCFILSGFILSLWACLIYLFIFLAKATCKWIDRPNDKKILKLLFTFLLSTKNICFFWEDISTVCYQHHCLPVRDNVHNLAFLNRLVALLNVLAKQIIVLQEKHWILFRWLYNFSHNENVNRTGLRGQAGHHIGTLA